MAGHVIYYYLKETNKYEITTLVYRNKLEDNSIIVDITNREDVINVINLVNPDIIINCIGVLIKGSKEHPDNAILINAYFPHFLKKIADSIQAKLIHISTDCVFSGKKGNYEETDFCDASDLYGRSKALGEIINDKDLTIRTSIIGPELKKNGEGLFHWFMHQSGSINGFITAIWGGVTTLELAKAVDYAIEKDTTGLVQLSNGCGITKFDLLSLIQRIWHKNIIINPYDGNVINKSIAKSHKFDYIVLDYDVMLNELYNWMNIHNFLYKDIYK